MKRPQSYSSISTFEKCPHLFEWYYVLGNQSPISSAAARGNNLHANLEIFFRGGPYPTLNKELLPWRQYMERLTLHTPTPEIALAMTSEWEPTTFGDENAYARGKLDLQHAEEGNLHVYDWKSGRIYPSHEGQGEFYVALSPPSNIYHTHFVYLDQPTVVVSRTYTCRDQAKLREKYAGVINKINETTEYTPTPSEDACRFCPRSWRAGGDCKAAP